MAELTENKHERTFRVSGFISLLKKYKLSDRNLTVCLTGNKNFTGEIRWFDDYAIKIITPEGSITIPIHNVLYYKCEHFCLDGEVENLKAFKGKAKTTCREIEQLNKYKMNKELLHFYMKDGSEVRGRIQWFEEYVYAVRADKSNVDCMITKRQILYYRKVNVH